MTKSPFSRGASAITEAKSQESDGVKFLSVKPDSKIYLVPLIEIDDLISIQQHAFWKVNPAIMFPDVEGSPARDIGSKPKFRAFMPVLAGNSKDVESMEPYIYSIGIGLARDFSETAEDIDIKGLMFTLKRSGSNLKTTYSLTNIGKRVDVDDQPEIDIISRLGTTDVDKQKELLVQAGLFKLGLDVDDSSDDDDTDWDELD